MIPIAKETLLLSKLEEVFSHEKFFYFKHRMLEFLFLFVILLCYSVKMAAFSFFEHEENNYSPRRFVLWFMLLVTCIRLFSLNNSLSRLLALCVLFSAWCLTFYTSFSTLDPKVWIYCIFFIFLYM